jgi:MFS family permease
MSLIDKLGRKTLLMIGAAGTAACLGGVAYLFNTNAHSPALLGLLVTYIAFFSVSQGAVIWVYIGEVFPNRVRAKGQSLGSFSHWFMNALISGIFPLMAASSLCSGDQNSAGAFRGGFGTLLGCYRVGKAHLHGLNLIRFGVDRHHVLP